MKGLILAGGKGTRLRPITFSMAKQLVPVANKPVVEYGLEAMQQAGIREFGIIVGDTAEEVMLALGDGSRWGVSLTYIPQPDPLGLAHAVKTARTFLGDEDFLMYLGDNMIKASLDALIEEFDNNRPAATILLTPVPNPSDFGVAEMEEGQVTRLEEKPRDPKSNLALVGVYLFDHRIHDVIAKLKPSRRGEYEITDAIQGLIDGGCSVRSHIVDGWWKDTGTVEAMLEANRLILEDLAGYSEGEVDDRSSLNGRVRIGAGTRIENSVLRGPIVIGRNCTIKDSYIGPFTAIDDETTIDRTEIEYSIVMRSCQIEELPHRVSASLIGRGVTARASVGRPRALQLVMGDNSSVAIP
ncbi:MAG: glucose-1-phosphate thymidylyltransferase [Fimbriimonadaceae bacterium]|nr:glucose-1-phosphate thymidylyltransferase [Fimbriimonadaceae bacterium]QYK55658.1 MAG: glucose-1-phosphate thymidylyltransferase [Fimbriimonadaceae bacterium]